MPARIRRELAQFFTRAHVAEPLLASLALEDEARVLDLGSGDGALSHAAARHFHRLAITSVDIDPSRSPPFDNDFGPSGHRHVVGDALDTALADQIGAVPFDAVLCNPPYLRLEWQERFRPILASAHLSELASGDPRRFPAEILFFARALSLARPGASMMFLWPDAILSARRHARFRASMAARIDVRRVVRLPQRAFANADVSAYAVFAVNQPPSGDPPAFETLTAEHGLQPGEDGEGVGHGPAAGRHGRTPTLADLGVAIARGKATSVDRRKGRFPVFHTSDFNADEVAFDWTDAVPGQVYAEAGDILVARVDRRLENKVCLVTGGRRAITDVVLRLRVPARDRDAVFCFLRSDRGKAALNAISRGTAARMITKFDLSNLRI